jgi:glycosyltransferase involved in cell wall biosynthesis
MLDIVYSIIIPVKEINDYIRETVSYIQKLNEQKWELIILPNQQSLDEWGDDRIKLFSTDKVGPARKRDIGAKLAGGKYLVFFDDDSYPDAGYFDTVDQLLSKKGVVALGGPAITPPHNTFWQRVSGAVFLSTFSGGMPERYVSSGDIREIDDWPSVNFIVEKDAFLNVGGFDSPYWPGERYKTMP